jgi:lipid II:glycine glycyltransferase (peptidoglycan interpeptide bridge formation enzyme)
MLSPNYVYIVTIPCFEDIRPFMWNSYGVGVSYEYNLDLSKSLDEIWAGFDSSCKKDIKGCIGLPLELRQVSDTETFCRIMDEQLAVKGVKFQSLGPDYLRDILAAFPENIRMYFLYNGSEIAGINTVIEYKDKLVGWLGNTNSNGNGFFNEYIWWELIERARAKGLKEYLIPGGDQKRLATFKSKFNPSTQVNFVLTRKDAPGAIAEWLYKNVVKGWL